MTTKDNARYFKIEKKHINFDMPTNVNFGFDNGEYCFYNITQVSLLSNEIIEDNESDEDNDSPAIELELELQKATIKMDSLTNLLLKNGCKVITSEEYKFEEQKFKDSQTNHFIDTLSTEEKFVHEKIKQFLEEYDIIKPHQKQFVASLCSCIASGENISELYLEMHAENLKKDVNKIFNYGEQSMICDFAKKVQLEISTSSNTNKKQLKI